MFQSRILAIVLSSATFLLAHPAYAGVLFTTGAMTEISAPVSFVEGDTESSSAILILDEGLTVLPGEIIVNAVGVGTHTGASGPDIHIPGGSLVQTYIVHFDPVGGIFATATGDVIFDPGETIIGIQTHTPYLYLADPAVGHPDATYPPTAPIDDFRAFETLPGTDKVTIAPGLGSASFELFAELGIDQARIVTAPVPEPSTFALAAVGLLGLLGWRQRRRRQESRVTTVFSDLRRAD